MSLTESVSTYESLISHFLIRFSNHRSTNSHIGIIIIIILCTSLNINFEKHDLSLINMYLEICKYNFAASSVIRMIQKSLKPGTFQRAVNLYLTERRFNTSTPNDLWSAFDKAIKETNDLGDWQIDMKTLMHGWTNERGYPVVYATLKANTITLTQVVLFFLIINNYFSIIHFDEENILIQNIL